MVAAPLAREDESTWTRLRRRKVVQWGIAYAAGAWGFQQGLAYLSTLLNWPAQLQRLTGLALLTGLPIALVLAWYHGDRGEQRVGRAELAILTLLFLLGGGLFWRYQHTSETSAYNPVVAAEVAKPAATASAHSRPSIAVLPFENRSHIEDDAFFVDGIHDDILTQLTKVGALKVIARTSVEQFRDSKLTTREIGQKLGVTKVLEGGVQRAGDRVRVTVQLIDAASDAHLWAENYDRELSAANIFAIQSEVAAAIAGALKATLTPGERARVEAIPTQSLEAWEAYQLGRQRLAPRTSTGLAEAERYFKKAIELDPAFALPYVGLADALALQTKYGGAPLAANLERAEQAVGRALGIDRSLAEAWASSGLIAWFRDQHDRAEQMFHRAIELNPNYATAHHWFTLLLADRNRFGDALRHAETSVKLDPLSAVANASLGTILQQMGRFEEANSRYRKAIEINPGIASAYGGVGDVLAWGFGRVDRAIPWYERAVGLDQANPESLADLATLHRVLGDGARADDWLKRALKHGSQNAYVQRTAAMASYEAGDEIGARRFAARAASLDTWAIDLLCDDDRRNGDYSSAKTRYEKIHPELFAETALDIHRRNVKHAIDLAAVLLHTGEADRAQVLLDRSEDFILRKPRMGIYGYGIQDVEIHALRGERTVALAKLHEARKAGWWTTAYQRDLDPNLASIRDDPEFKAVFADMARDMAQQRARLAARPKEVRLEMTQAAR